MPYPETASGSLNLASDGKPSGFLDWNNNFGDQRDKRMVTHCSGHPKGFMGGQIEISNLDVLGEGNCFGGIKGTIAPGDMTYAHISTDDLPPNYVPHRIREFSTFSLLFGAGECLDGAAAEAKQRANALRALIKAEQDHGPDFLRLANALSALYPKGSEEKRLLDAMLLAVPR